LSSAILYLAIVAIWAVVLVPRWLHPRSAQPEPVLAGETMPGEEGVPEAVDDGGQEPAGHEPGDSPELVEDPGEPVPAFPAPAGRADILRARRRMLTALVVLTAGAVGLAVTGIAASWVIVPPAVLLLGFIVLLREAARADAERAHRTTRVRYAEAPPVADQEPGSFREEATASTDQAPDSQPDAEVIDISARISDQVYDQYSDAAERAVGD
jgi:hypothetical protein